MSTLQQPEEPSLRVLLPEEAVRAARRLPPPERLVVADVSEQEGEAFAEALAET